MAIKAIVCLFAHIDGWLEQGADGRSDQRAGVTVKWVLISGRTTDAPLWETTLTLASRPPPSDTF